MQFLLDTNIVSEVMRTRPNENVIQKWDANIGEFAVAATTWHELLFGIASMPESESRNRKEGFLKDLSRQLLVLPYDQVAADWHASERARLTSIGKTPAFADSQIAAIAAINLLTLVTANVSDFANFTGLEVEDWTKRK